MRKLTLFKCVCIVVVPAHAAIAFASDIQLSRLTTPAQGNGCAVGEGQAAAAASSVCADQQSWKRLALQLDGVTLRGARPVDSEGIRAFHIEFSYHLAGIDSDADYWQKSTRANVPGVIQRTELSLTKGLPFGFAVQPYAGYLWSFGLWSLGTDLHWALFESFDRGIFRWLPDFSVMTGVHAVLGMAQASLWGPQAGVVLSKAMLLAQVVELVPVLSGTWRKAIAPAATVPLQSLDADPVAGYFESVDVDRFFVAAALRARYESWHAIISFNQDLALSGVSELQRQWGAEIAVGISVE